MNYNHLVIFLFSLSAGVIYQNVEAQLSSEPIVRGVDATWNQFKYQVSIQNKNGEHFCGGGIIGDRYILTAAHCVVNEDDTFKSSEIVVVAGALHTADPYAITRDVETAYVLKSYNPINPYPWLPYSEFGDIAVLKLKRGLGLSYNTNLSKLKLPVNSANLYPNYDMETVVVAGYGLTFSEKIKVNGKVHSRNEPGGKLKFISAWVLPIKYCKRYYSPPILPSHICLTTDNGNTGTCDGDSGGPLVYQNDTVIGVVSFGPFDRCAKDYIPSVFTRVSSFTRFIQDVMDGKENDDMRIQDYTNQWPQQDKLPFPFRPIFNLPEMMPIRPMSTPSPQFNRYPPQNPYPPQDSNPTPDPTISIIDWADLP